MGERAQAPAAVRVSLRPIASPLALGFLALAVGSFTMSGLELSWIPSAQSPAAGLAVLAFVIPLQIASFLLGFLARDPAAATGMALQAGGWFAIGLVTFTSRPGQVSGALGLILLGAGTVMLVPAITAVGTKVLAAVVMALTSLRFCITAGYELTAGPGWQTAAGVAGLVLACVALYAGLAFELEDSRKSSVLPTFRRAGAFGDDLGDQVSGVPKEAGVRRRL